MKPRATIISITVAFLLGVPAYAQDARSELKLPPFIQFKKKLANMSIKLFPSLLLRDWKESLI